MCGLAGIIRFDGENISQHYLKNLEQKIAHRGPDGSGFLSWDRKNAFRVSNFYTDHSGSLAFVHRRLMIQDLTEQAFQPMISNDQSYALIFNGEIYNYRELKKILTKKGHHFKSDCDTEVLLVAYKEWGENVVDRLNGMFSFVILDINRSCVIIARDNLGIKPLYYFWDQNCFCFASEIKALFTLPWIQKKVDPQALYDILYHSHFDFPDKTFYQSIKPIPPGHLLKIDLIEPKHSQFRQYWKVPDRLNTPLSIAEIKQNLQTLWHESMDLHSQCKVSLGVSLSGGLDSSLIFASMSSHLIPVTTLSYIAEQKKVSEETWINKILKNNSTHHYPIYSSPSHFWNSLEKVFEIQDQPFGSLSVLAQYLVYKKAQELNKRVVLTGQGSDELFAGYYTFLLTKLRQLYKQQNYFDLFIIFLFMAYRYRTYLLPYLSQVFSSFPSRWIKQDFFDPLLYRQKTRFIDLKNHTKFHLTAHGLPTLLRLDDLNAMAHGVETRLPFLYKPLVEFAMQLPDHLLIDRKARTKVILRKVFKPLLPKSILTRSDKCGFIYQDKAIPKILSSQLHDRIASLPFIQNWDSSIPLKKMLYDKNLFKLLCVSYYYY